MIKKNNSVDLLSMARLKISLLALIVLGLTTSAWGESRIDPTVIPPAWLAAQPITPGAATVVAKDPTPIVQLIVIGKSRKFALIDGQVVKSGEILNESQIVDIKSGEVVTKDSSKSLKLNPSVEKKSVLPDSLRKTSDGNKNSRAWTKTIVIGNGIN
ncbi:MAG: hypothetical protein WCH01_05950 [Methylococcaceae bacterium]